MKRFYLESHNVRALFEKNMGIFSVHCYCSGLVQDPRNQGGRYPPQPPPPDFGRYFLAIHRLPKQFKNFLSDNQVSFVFIYAEKKNSILSVIELSRKNRYVFYK